jgi:hypothetical protein
MMQFAVQIASPNPRLVDRREAASYCSLRPRTFSAWVRKGRLPPPIEGTNRWDLKALDLALDSLSGIKDIEGSALDEWRAKRARRSEGNS